MHVPVLPLIALIYGMVTLGMVAAIVTRRVLSHFNLLVTGDRLMEDVIQPVPRAPPEPVQELSLLLWKLLTIAVECLLGVICVIFMPDIPAEVANHHPSS
jgi:hypothetical protein